MKNKNNVIVKAAMVLALVTYSLSSQAQWLTSGNTTAAPNNILGTNNATDLDIRAGGATRMYIKNSNGFVGIGTATPGFLLDIQNSGNASMNFKSASGNANILIDRGTSSNSSSVNYRTGGSATWQTGNIGNDNFVINNVSLSPAALTVLKANNNVGFGTATPSEKLHVIGNILSSGNISAVNFNGSGNIDVSGYVGFGSVEQLTDGGANTIASNSNFVPLSDCVRDLGTSALRWRDIYACGTARVGTTAAVLAPLSVAQTTLNSLTGAGAFQIGETTAANLAADNNEIQARNNGTASTLFLQFSGGNIDANSAGGNAIFHGNVGVGTSSPAVPLHVTTGSDISPSGGGRIVSGSTAGENVGIDENEIMARNNGVAANLFLNNNGGNVTVGGAASTSRLGVNTSAPATNFHVIHEQFVGAASAGGMKLTNVINSATWTEYVSQSSSGLALYFNDALRGTFDNVSGAYAPVSDAKLKKNVEGLPKVMDKIMLLKPSQYEFKHNTEAGKKYFGFIAQDLEKVFPEVVKICKDDSNGNGEDLHTVKYTELIPVLFKALQEEHEASKGKEVELESVKNELAQLIETVGKLDQALSQCCMSHSEKSSVTANSNDIAKLEQNAPNPFSENTVINYYIPATVANALVKVYSLSGSEMVSLPLTGKGFGQVEISGKTLSNGTYTYLLLVDGKAIDSKQMVLTK